jgi:glycosyltransferase involved in cell wall biosynthesis
MTAVSVVMPMRNAESYVEDAVRSVLAQTFRDFELVVVDDGGSDGSAALVRRFDDARLRVVPGPARGFPAAWNAGLEACRGELLVQVDADDLIPPDRLEWQLRALREAPAVAAVCGGMSTIDPAGRPVMTFAPPSSAAEDITEELLSATVRTSFCTWAVPVRLLRSVGGMREYFESSCDLDLQFRLAEAGRVRFEPRLAYLYRLHDASVTHRQGSGRRRFFEGYARDLRRQRARGGPDDLQQGRPAAPPAADSAPSGSVEQIRGMLLGEAWRTHAAGRRWAAFKLGVRALAAAPWRWGTWRSVAALLVKPSRKPDAS